MAKPVPSPVSFHFVVPRFRLRDQRRLKLFILNIFKQEKKSLRLLSVILCTDAFLMELNQQFLSHDTLTDIITFNLSNPSPAIEAEIYISVERVRDNSKFFKSTFSHELHRVIFHGVLHLCGFSDKSKRSKSIMKQKEDLYLHAYFVPRGT